MEQDGFSLVHYGATVLAIPCNTAHYFYDRLAEALPVPVLNMPRLTVADAKRRAAQSWASLPRTARWRLKPTRLPAGHRVSTGPCRHRSISRRLCQSFMTTSSRASAPI